MRRTTTKKLEVPVIVLIVLSMTLIPALTSPITSPVIVVLSGDEPVIYTANKISELLQNAIIVKKNNIFENLILMRAVGEVIYVGHGTQQGIKVGGNIVSWENFAKEIHRFPSKTIYVAACYSENLAKIVEKKGLSKLIFGFKGLVDVDEAAYITTAIITVTKGNIEKTGELLKELTKIMFGKITEPWKYKLWLLAAHDVRGIWWVYWREYSYYWSSPKVEYTHPNTYKSVDPNHYYNIGIEDDAVIEGDNFLAHHIPKSAIDEADIASKLAGPLMALAIALAALVGWIPAGAFAAALAALAAFICATMSVTLNDLLRDESGSGWVYAKDITTIKLGWVPLYAQGDFKFGKSWWCRAIWYYPRMDPVMIPLWYGGRDLGIGGI